MGIKCSVVLTGTYVWIDLLVAQLDQTAVTVQVDSWENFKLSLLKKKKSNVLKKKSQNKYSKLSLWMKKNFLLKSLSLLLKLKTLNKLKVELIAENHVNNQATAVSQTKCSVVLTGTYAW